MAGEITFTFRGMPEFVAALEQLPVYAYLGARRAVDAAAALVELETKKSLTRYSHPKGTPTPSPPGQPPAIVGGALRRSVRVRKSYSLGPGQWAAQVGPTIVYGRIQELGGVTGRGHRTTLPARPYLGPSVKRLIDSGELAEAYEAAWRLAMGVD